MVTEAILKRGLEKVDVVTISEIAKALGTTTNCQQGGFGFFNAAEKHLKNEINQGGVNFIELSKIAENLLGTNIGSNEFHSDLEKFLIVNFNEEN